MVGSQGFFVGVALALVLAGASPAGAADCDRARSILAERDRVGDIAAMHPRRDCARGSNADLGTPKRRAARQAPEIQRGSAFIGFGSDPLAYSPGFNPPPPRP